MWAARSEGAGTGDRTAGAGGAPASPAPEEERQSEQPVKTHAARSARHAIESRARLRGTGVGGENKSMKQGAETAWDYSSKASALTR